MQHVKKFEMYSMRFMPKMNANKVKKIIYSE